MKRQLYVLMIGVATAGWAAWLVAAPIVAASRPGEAAAVATALTYRAGAVICHQQAARSFHVAGVRMPVCARCFGLYAGASAGALAVLAWTLGWRRRAGGTLRLPLTPVRWLVVASGVPTIAAWVGEHAAGVAVPGSARALAAAPLGAAVAALVALWAGGAAFDDRPPGSAVH